jgi:hypothetical protein
MIGRELVKDVHSAWWTPDRTDDGADQPRASMAECARRARVQVRASRPRQSGSSGPGGEVAGPAPDRQRQRPCPGPYLSAFTWLGLRSLRKRYWGQHLWARGYWAVSSGNVTDEAWTEYIKSRVAAREFKTTRFDGFLPRLPCSKRHWSGLARALFMRPFRLRETSCRSIIPCPLGPPHPPRSPSGFRI